MSETLAKRVSIPEDVMISRVEDEIVLLNLENEQYFALDDIGARVWELLSEYGSTDIVIEQVTTEYDVEPDVFRTDLEKLLSDLFNAGLVTIQE
jgi:hypothetical protein